MKIWILHIAVLLALVLAQLVLPPYHANNLSRILVLAVFAMGYNVSFGYAGLLPSTRWKFGHLDRLSDTRPKTLSYP